MARRASLFVAGLALVALFACAQADVYSDNVKAFSVAVKRFPDYSIFANYYVNYSK